MSEAARLEAVAARLEAVAARLEGGGGFVAGTAAPAAGGGGAAPASVAAFQALMNGPMVKFIALSDKIGGVTAEAGGKVKEAFEVVGELDMMSTVCKKPPASALGDVFGSLTVAIKAVTGIKKPKDRKDPANLFLDAINGAIGGLGFVAATEKSWETVQAGIESFRFVGDKILMAYRKEGPQDYCDWQASYEELLKALKAFAKDYHGMGLKWQPEHSGIAHTEYVPGQVATSGGAAPAPVAAAGGGSSAPAAAGGATGAWGTLSAGSLAEFLKLSAEVGDEIAEMAGHTEEAFTAVGGLLAKAEACKKPSDVSALFTDLNTALKAATSVKPPKRSSPLDLHYKCLKSSVNCLAFVAYEMKTWEPVQNCLEEMEFNGNKLLQQFRKDGPEVYVKWHGSLKTLLTDVKQFAKDHAPTGLKWNPSGGDVSSFSDPRAAKATPSAGSGGKGKGKGKGPPKMMKSQTSPEELAALRKKNEEEKAKRAAAAPQVSASDALFAELSALGEDGGSMKEKLGLKKAKKGTATDREKVVSKAPPKKETASTKKKTVRPMTEGYEGADLLKLAYCHGTRASKERKTLTVEQPRRDAVLIMECEDVAIEIVGVCKNISIAGCKRFNISLEGSIGQVEVSNCDSGYVTINGVIFQLTCDKCNGLEVTLSPEAYEAKIVSSMCSSLNIALDNPDKSAEMEFLALAVPTQYESKLVFKGTQVEVVTEAVSHNFG